MAMLNNQYTYQYTPFKKTHLGRVSLWNFAGEALSHLHAKGAAFWTWGMDG